jgi:3-oxoacyl-[acyl-carrier protein] reductase
MNPMALITGGSRGIGRGIALELARLGYDLLINYKDNQSAAQQTAVDCQCIAMENDKNPNLEIYRADISQAEDRKKLIDFAKSRFNGLDLLVNNAGAAPEIRADMLGAGEESFDRMMNVNVKGPFFLTQLAARWMVEQVTTPGYVGSRPKIVTIGSISSYASSTHRADYCISKAALTMLTPLFADRLAEFGIKVYEIRPGIIETDMTAPVKKKYDELIEGGLTPIRRWGAPADVAKAVAAIAQELFPFSTGEVINVDGGFHLRRL